MLTHGQWLGNVHIFDCDSDKEHGYFMMTLSFQIQMIIIGKAEVIASIGETADRMHIIAKGVIGTSSGAVHCTGGFIGEDMLLRNGKYPRTYNSLTYVTMHVRLVRIFQQLGRVFRTSDKISVNAGSDEI